MAKKAQYSKPTSQVDLEERQKKDYVPPSQVGGTEDPGQSENGYIATDPIYQNHADHTHAPYQADEKSAEGKLFAQQYSDDVDFDATNAPDSVDDASDDDDGAGQQSTTASGGAAKGPGEKPSSSGKAPRGQQSPPGGGSS
jgi:hypothetical protein